MTAPDPLHVRGYQLVLRVHEQEVSRAYTAIQTAVTKIGDDLDSARTLALGEAQNLPRYVADLVAHLSALKALDEVAFLTTNPDTEEQP